MGPFQLWIFYDSVLLQISAFSWWLWEIWLLVFSTRRMVSYQRPVCSMCAELPAPRKITYRCRVQSWQAVTQLSKTTLHEIHSLLLCAALRRDWQEVLAWGLSSAPTAGRTRSWSPSALQGTACSHPFQQPLPACVQLPNQERLPAGGLPQGFHKNCRTFRRSEVQTLHSFCYFKIS